MGRRFVGRKALVASTTVQQKNAPQTAETASAQQHAPGTSVAPTPANADVRGLEQPVTPSDINTRIEQHLAERHRRQDQQELYSSVWSGLAAAIIKTQPATSPSESRRRFEQLLQELSLAEERERKRKRGERDDTFLRALVTLVGEKEAQSITEKIESLQKSSSTSSQDIAQLAKDIASKLSANDSLLNLHTGTESVERPSTDPDAATPHASTAQRINNIVPIPGEPLDIRHPLNHPVPEIRDALIQMAQPNGNPSGGNVSMPEIEPIARQLFTAAKNLGYSGTRDQFSEALYHLSHRVESGQGIQAEQILQLTQQSFVEKGEVPSPHLTSIVTDVLARVQYAKAASINAGEVAHFILRDGEQPAKVHGQLLADSAADILASTGGFGPLGAHGFGAVTPPTPAPAPSSSKSAVRNLEASTAEAAPTRPAGTSKGDLRDVEEVKAQPSATAPAENPASSKSTVRTVEASGTEATLAASKPTADTAKTSAPAANPAPPKSTVRTVEATATEARPAAPSASPTPPKPAVRNLEASTTEAAPAALKPTVDTAKSAAPAPNLAPSKPTGETTKAQPAAVAPAATASSTKPAVRSAETPTQVQQQPKLTPASVDASRVEVSGATRGFAVPSSKTAAQRNAEPPTSSSTALKPLPQPPLKKIVPGAHSAENLSHNPEIKLPANSAAPTFKVATVADLTKQLKELGQKSALALARGDVAAARELEIKANDTLQDNKTLVATRSAQEQSVVNSLALQTKVAELKRLEGIKASAERAIGALQAEIARDAATKSVSGKCDVEQAKKTLEERTGALLATLDPAAASLLSEAFHRDSKEAFLKTLSQSVEQVAQADRQALEAERAKIEKRFSAALHTSLEAVKAPGGDFTKALNAATRQATADVEKSLQSPELHALLARNPEAGTALRESVESQKKRVIESASSADDFLKRASKDLENALQFNPVVGPALLEGPQGPKLIKDHLARLNDGEARAKFLASLQITLGSQKFSSLVDSYDTTSGRPLALDIVEMSTGNDARRATFQRFTGTESLLTPAQQARLKDSVQRDHALTRAAIKEELKQAGHALDENAKKIVEARNHLGQLLGQAEKFTKLPDAQLDQEVISAVRTSYGLSTKATLDETLSALRSKAGAISRDEKGQEQYAPVTAEERKTVQVIVRLREIQGLREQGRALRELQAEGADRELVRHEQKAAEVFGEALGSPDNLKTLESEAAAYLQGLKGKISRAEDGEPRNALIAERDAVEWRVATKRLELALAPERPDPKSAALLLNTYLAAAEPPRGQHFAQRAERGIRAIEAARQYAAKAEQVSREPRPVDLSPEEKLAALKRTPVSTVQCHTPKKDEAGGAAQPAPSLTAFFAPKAAGSTQPATISEALKEIPVAPGAVADTGSAPPPGSLAAAVLSTTPGRLSDGESRLKAEATFNKQLTEATGLLLGEIAGYGARADKELLTPARQYQLRLGGSTGSHTELEEDWRALREVVSSSGRELAATLPVHSGSFIAKSPEKPEEITASSAAAKVQEALSRPGGAPLTESQLQQLRKDAGEIPELRDILAQVPASTAFGHVQAEEQSRQLLARLTPEDEKRVRLLALNQEREPRAAGAAWRSIRKLDEQTLSIELEAAQAHTKIRETQRILESLSEADRSRAEAIFAEQTGQSVGSALLAVRPLGQRGTQMLLVLCATTLVTDNDMRQFFPAGAQSFASPKARTDELAKLIKADAAVNFVPSADERKRFEETSNKQATERGHWSAVLQAAARSGDSSSAERARSEMKRLDKELTLAREALLGQHPVDFVARSGHREALVAMQRYTDQAAAAAALGEGSKYALVTKRVVESLRDATPGHVRAYETLRKGSFSEAESTLVRVLYAEKATASNVAAKERKLSGDLARDLSRSTNPNDPETKRAELLARGGPSSLTQADVSLVFDAKARGDQRDTLRGLVALKTAGALHEVSKMLEESGASAEAKGYLKAVQDNDTVRQAGYELKSGLINGTVTSAEALSSLKGLPAEGLQALGSVPGLSASLGQYAPAWEKMIAAGTFDEGVKLAAETALKASDTDVIASAFSLVAPGQAGALSRHLDASLPAAQRGIGWLEAVRRSDGWAGAYNAAFLESVQSRAVAGQQISPEQLAKIRALKESLALQMGAIGDLYGSRKGLNDKSVDVWRQVIKEREKASADYDSAPVLRQICSSYGLRVQNHQDFLQKQEGLFRDQLKGLNDIQQTKRIMAVLGVVMVDDIMADRKHGVALSHVETEHGDLKRRDMARDCWVVVRPDQFKEWIRKDREYRDSIHRWELSAEAAHCVAKLAVVAVISTSTWGVGAAFAVSTVWNIGDKLYRYTVSGESLKSVLTWGGLELALDAVSFGVASKVAYTVRASKQLGEKVVEQTVKGTTRVLKNKAAQQTVAHAGDLARNVDSIADLQRITKPIAAAVKETGESVVQEIGKHGHQWVELAVEWGKTGRMYSLHLPDFSAQRDEPKVDVKENVEVKPVVEEKGDPTPIPQQPIQPPAPIPVVEPAVVPPAPKEAVVQAQQEILAAAQQVKEAVEKRVADLTVAIEQLKNALNDARQYLSSEEFRNIIAGYGAYVASVIWAAQQALAKAEDKLAEPPKEPERKQPNPDETAKQSEPVKPAETPAAAKEPEKGLYEDLRQHFTHDIFAFLNTGGLFDFSSPPIFVSPNIPPPQPPMPPSAPTVAKAPPPPPPPKPGLGVELSPKIEESLNTYVIQLMQEQKLAEAKALAEPQRLAEAEKIQQAAAQQQAAAVAATQELAQVERERQQQATAQHQQQQQAAVAQVKQQEQQASAEQVKQQAQQQQEAQAVMQAAAAAQSAQLSAAIRLSEESAATLTISQAIEQPLGTGAAQRAAQRRAAEEVEHLALAARVDDTVSKTAAQKSPVRLAETVEQAAQRQAAEAEQLTEAQERSKTKQAVEGIAQREAERALEQEAERLLAARSTQAPVQPQLQEAVAHIIEPQPALSQPSALAHVEQATKPLGLEISPIELTTIEKLEAAAQAIEQDEREEGQRSDERTKARKAKALRAKARLREILMHQLQSILFEQNKKQRMLQLLISLGISEKEYRELVAKIGEMEAKAQAQTQEQRKQAVAVERQPQRQSPEPLRAAKPLAGGKSPLRMKEPTAQQEASKAAAPQPSRVSRAELYVRMKD